MLSSTTSPRPSSRGGGKTPLIVLLGPTASGKTDLSLKLAKKFSGEIISADSRQVYCGLDIGTAKVPISPASRRREATKSSIPSKDGIHSPITVQGIPHHLIDVASPKRTFSVAQYQKLGRKAIKQILRKGKIPLIVGGTGHYIESLIYNQQLPEVKPNSKLRKRLEKLSIEKIFTVLKKKDPARARTIDKHNKRRLIRALEIIETLGRVPPSPNPSHQGRGMAPHFPPPGGEGSREGGVLILGLKRSDKKLRQSINRRVDTRVTGIIKEIKQLRRQKISFKRLINFGLEYRYFSLYLQGKLTKQQALDELKKSTWRYAKRQYTWFRRLPIIWIYNQKQAEIIIQRFVKG